MCVFPLWLSGLSFHTLIRMREEDITISGSFELLIDYELAYSNLILILEK